MINYISFGLQSWSYTMYKLIIDLTTPANIRHIIDNMFSKPITPSGPAGIELLRNASLYVPCHYNKSTSMYILDAQYDHRYPVEQKQQQQQQQEEQKDQEEEQQQQEEQEEQQQEEQEDQERQED